MWAGAAIAISHGLITTYSYYFGNPNDDSDLDGVPNAIEFVLGGTGVTNNGNGTDNITLKVSQVPGGVKFARLKVAITE